MSTRQVRRSPFTGRSYGVVLGDIHHRLFRIFRPTFRGSRALKTCAMRVLFCPRALGVNQAVSRTTILDAQLGTKARTYKKSPAGRRQGGS